MTDIDEFVQKLVEIRIVEPNRYGFHPFQLFIENKEGEFILISVVDVTNVRDMYKLFLKYIQEKSKRIYMAVDFPAGGDMENDFVVVFKSEGELFDMFAIPYNNLTGEVYDRIPKSRRLKQIAGHFIYFTLN